MPRNELARIEPSSEPQRVEVLPAPRQDLTMDELWMVAEQACKSGLYADSAKNPSAAFMLALRCQAEGIHPGLAFAQFHVIEGRPSLRADAMQARYQQAGGRVRWIRTDNEVCEAEFWHPTLSPEPVRIRKTLAEFKANGVAQSNQGGLKPNWKKFPDAMLRARVISAGVRAVLPAVVCGIYTPEEVMDMGREAVSAPTPSPGPPIAAPDETSPETALSAPPPAPSFRDFCQEVASRGVMDALGVCRELLHWFGEAIPEQASHKQIGMAAKKVWDHSPERAIEHILHIEDHQANQTASDDSDDLPDLDPSGPAPEPEATAEEGTSSGLDLPPNDSRRDYLDWATRVAQSEGLEPIDVLRIIHDAGVARKAITAVADRNDTDLLLTRGRIFWSKDPEAASRAIDLATGGDPAPPRSKADRVADQL